MCTRSTVRPWPRAGPNVGAVKRDATSEVTAVLSGANGTQRRRAGPPSARAMAREQDIIDAAAEMFHRRGYAATTLQDIADAVGILKGSLYYYIDGKEDLLYRITSVIHDEARANLAAARSVRGTTGERLRVLCEGHVLSFGRHLTKIRVFYTEYGSLSPERRRQIMAERRAYEAFVEQLVVEGQRDGSFCPDLDPHVMTNAVLTLVNTLYLWYKPQRDAPIETVAKAYADFTLHGLHCAPDHEHPPRPARARR